MAKKLLIDASHREDDPEIKNLIIKRLRAIEAEQQPPSLTAV